MACHIVVVSKDRPWHLRQCLQSLQQARGSPSAGLTTVPVRDVRVAVHQITVVSKCSTRGTDAAYDAVIAAITINAVVPVKHIRETARFRDAFLQAIDGSPSQTVLLSVDDALWLDLSALPTALHVLNTNEGIIGHIWKLHPGIAYSQPADRVCPPPSRLTGTDSAATLVTWDARPTIQQTARSDWGYPFCLASGLYRKADLMHLAFTCSDANRPGAAADGRAAKPGTWHHPNSLETWLNNTWAAGADAALLNPDASAPHPVFTRRWLSCVGMASPCPPVLVPTCEAVQVGTKANRLYTLPLGQEGEGMKQLLDSIGGPPADGDDKAQAIDGSTWAPPPQDAYTSTTLATQPDLDLQWYRRQDWPCAHIGALALASDAASGTDNTVSAGAAVMGARGPRPTSISNPSPLGPIHAARISFLVPVHNAAHTLHRALSSIEAAAARYVGGQAALATSAGPVPSPAPTATTAAGQIGTASSSTHRPLVEVVLVDDGSADGSLDLMLSWAVRVTGVTGELHHSLHGHAVMSANGTSTSQPACSSIVRVVVVQLHSNLGVARALNVGWRHCSGDLVARLDADDECSTDRLVLQARFLQANPDVAAVGCSVAIVDDRHSSAPPVIMAHPRHPLLARWVSWFGTPLPHPGTTLRRAAFDSAAHMADRPVAMADADADGRDSTASQESTLGHDAPTQAALRQHTFTSSGSLAGHHAIIKDITVSPDADPYPTHYPVAEDYGLWLQAQYRESREGQGGSIAEGGMAGTKDEGATRTARQHPGLNRNELAEASGQDNEPGNDSAPGLRLCSVGPVCLTLHKTGGNQSSTRAARQRASVLQARCDALRRLLYSSRASGASIIPQDLDVETLCHPPVVCLATCDFEDVQGWLEDHGAVYSTHGGHMEAGSTQAASSAGGPRTGDPSRTTESSIRHALLLLSLLCDEAVSHATQYYSEACTRAGQLKVFHTQPHDHLAAPGLPYGHGMSLSALCRYIREDCYARRAVLATMAGKYHGAEGAILYASFMLEAKGPMLQTSTAGHAGSSTALPSGAAGRSTKAAPAPNRPARDPARLAALLAGMIGNS